MRVQIPKYDSPARTVTVEGTVSDVENAKKMMERFLGWSISAGAIALEPLHHEARSRTNALPTRN